jgi:ADP-ribosylglycohydrolase
MGISIPLGLLVLMYPQCHNHNYGASFWKNLPKDLQEGQILNVTDYDQTLKKLNLPNLLAQPNFQELFINTDKALKIKSISGKTIKENPQKLEKILLPPIIGDSIGAAFEFKGPNKDGLNFKLWGEKSGITDDSVMTLATAAAVKEILELKCNKSEKIIEIFKCKYLEFYKKAISSSKDRHVFRNGGGFGCWFSKAVRKNSFQEMYSCGNGSAMRCSYIAYMFESLLETLMVADLSAVYTHKHEYGRLGAVITSSAIWLAIHGFSQAEMKSFLLPIIPDDWQGNDLNETDKFELIRPNSNHQWEICQKTICPALIAFLYGTSFENVLRRAVSYGGDTDTIAAIACSIAGAYFGVPGDEERTEVLERFKEEYPKLFKHYEELNEFRNNRVKNGLSQPIIRTTP